MTNVCVELLPHGFSLPLYQSAGAAGADVFSANLENITLKPFERIAIPLGIKIQLPENYEAQIRPRSGLVLKNGITIPNSPGTIDSDYCGELKVIIMNVSDTIFIIERGMRIAQIVIQPIIKTNFIQIDQIDSNTARGVNGFGSTGVKNIMQEKA